MRMSVDAQLNVVPGKFVDFQYYVYLYLFELA